jgi:hypothetical protein
VHPIAYAPGDAGVGHGSERWSSPEDGFVTRLVKRMFLVSLLLVSGLVSWGCSGWVANRGILPSTVHNPEMRAEVRNLFGPPYKTDSCPDGRVLERYWIRTKIELFECNSFAAAMGCAAIEGAYQGSFGLFDVFVLPVTLVRSERAKLHYAFVYDKTDRVLYRFDLKAPSAKRFSDVTAPLSETLYGQLKDSKCDSWTTCFTEYTGEIRRRAACVEYTLSTEDETRLTDILALGEAVDAQRVSFKEGMHRFSFFTGIEQPSSLPESTDAIAGSGTDIPEQETK